MTVPCSQIQTGSRGAGPNFGFGRGSEFFHWLLFILQPCCRHQPSNFS
jgi:hypothetical protein